MSQSPIPDFTVDLFMALFEMDAEAEPAADGSPTGLNYYGRYRHPDQAKPQTEPSWTQRLKELLEAFGHTVRKECSYPDSPGCSPSNFCDNVVTFADGRILWLENKGAWKDYWVRKGMLGKFRSHLLVSQNSAAHDVQKLAPLVGPHADYVGLLLIGFDTISDPMDAEMDEFRRVTLLDRLPWMTASVNWPDRWRVGHRIWAWFFWRTVEGEGSAYPTSSS
ncbi:MAG TPA: hypothetical protein VG269_25120, partial [Tepidisphaeraceae bacterium]|nr:hypothetical protein [Tepidisphaeraceae bacterium]